MAEGESKGQSTQLIEALGSEDTEEEVTTTLVEGKYITNQYHIHKNLFLGNVYHGKGDIVQESKTQVKDSQIEALIGIENADDTSAGNQTHRKQILGNPDPGTSDTAPGARRKTKPPSGTSDSPTPQHLQGLSEDITQAAFGWIGEEKIPSQEIENNEDDESCSIRASSTQNSSDLDRCSNTKINKTVTCSFSTETIQENDFDIDLILLDAFKELELENADNKTASEMICLYIMEEIYQLDVEQDIKDFLPLFTKIWRTIQLKIVFTSLERHVARSYKIPSPVQDILIKLISIYNEEQSLHSFIPRVNDVIKLGEQFRSNENFIHAVISFYAAGKLFKLRNDGNNSVLGITDCVGRILLVDPMREKLMYRRIIIDHLIPLVHEMKEMLRSIQGSTTNIRVEYEAWCLNYIGSTYFECLELEQSAKMFEAAIDLLKKELFDVEADEYRVYGNSLGNAGSAYFYIGEFSKTIEKNTMALIAANKAKDWEGDEKKNEFISFTKKRLQLSKAATI